MVAYNLFEFIENIFGGQDHNTNIVERYYTVYMLMKHNIKLTSEFGKTMCRYNIITGHDSFTGFEESTSDAIYVMSLFIEIE